jgi:hypothetical protein
MGTVVFATFRIELPPGAGAQEHAEFDGLLQGGDSSAAHANLLWPAWIFGALMLSLLAALLMRPATRTPIRKGARAGARGLLVSTVVLQAAFAGIVLSYRHGMDVPGGAETWGPFPAPTTWALLIFFPCQVLFVIHFVVGFRRWFWTDDDDERFESIVRERRSGAER